jgi:rhodanese-related sulfurtransferase/DNA-binding HxlR family transcriptional regulator
VSTPPTNVKHQLFLQFARIGKALANANRLAIIETLAQGERSVDALAKVSGLSVANVSQHLQQLRQAGLVDNRKHGQYVYYRLSGDDVIGLLNAVRTVADRHLADVSRLVENYLDSKDELEPVSADELLHRLERGEITVIDVRPEQEYRAGHLPGAVNVPLSRLRQHMTTLPVDVEIIAYCRGPYCVLSYDAVAELRARGFRARRLENGYPEWRIAGMPVETSF